MRKKKRITEEGKESGRIERMTEEKKDDERWKRNNVIEKRRKGMQGKNQSKSEEHLPCKM